MNDFLLYRRVATPRGIQTSVYWSVSARVTYAVDEAVTPETELPAYSYGRGNLVDAWCDGTTRNEVYYVSVGEVEVKQLFNSGLCSLPPCGLSIVSVLVTGAEQSGPNATATVIINDYAGPVEYSLNNFVDIQSGNVFAGLTIGSYVAYARPVGNPSCAVSYPFEIKPDWRVRWVIPYATDNGKLARVEIEDRDWSGPTEELTGGPQPATLEYPPIGDKIGLLGGSGLSIQILLEREGLLSDLYTADERKFRVTLYEESTLVWRGYLLPEFYEEPWVSVGTHPTVRLSASDGIGALPDVYYVVENGLRYYGRASKLEILRRCLDKLDLDLPFYTSVNLWETRMDTALDPLAQSYVEQEQFYDGTTPRGCGEVLERILQPHLPFIRQAHGALHVIPHPNRKAPYVRRKYAPDGTFLLEEPFEQLDMIARYGEVSYRGGSQIVSMRPAITLGRVILDYGNLKNFVPNGGFEDWNGNTPNGWSGDAQTERALTEEGDAFRLKLSNKFTGTSIISTATDYRNLSTGALFSFDWELIFNQHYLNATVWAMVQIGGRYVREVNGRYELTDEESIFRAIYVPRNIDAFNGDESHKGTTSIPILYLPDAGQITVRLYQPFTDWPTADPSVYSDEIKAFIDNVRVEPYILGNVKKMIVEGKNPGYNTVKPFELTLYTGSGIPQCDALVSLEDFTPTDLWGPGYLLQENTLREILFQHARPTRVLRATLTNPSPIGVVKDPDMIRARFAVDGYTLDHKTGQAQIEAYEIFGGVEDLIPVDAMLYEDGEPMLYEDGTYMLYEG